VEGLVHVSEIVDRRIAHPEEVLEDGDVVPLKIVRIEHDRHRLGLSLREARGEAELRGWQFDGDGRIMTLNDDAREKFAEETTAIETRLEQRRTTEAEQMVVRAQEAASQPEAASTSGRGTTPVDTPDTGPVLTAMQQAMKQAQARQEDSMDDEPVEEPAAEADAEEATEAVVEEVAAERDAAKEPAAEAPTEEAPEAAAEAEEPTTEVEDSEEEQPAE
jgi:predicted RNA-binding protein with RPS1 domain